MSKRVPGSHRTREALRELMEGRRPESFGRTELVQLATRLIIEEGLEAEVRDALDRDYYEHGAPGFIDYSEAPLPTDQHIELLEEMERALD